MAVDSADYFQYGSEPNDVVPKKFVDSKTLSKYFESKRSKFRVSEHDDTFQIMMLDGETMTFSYLRGKENEYFLDIPASVDIHLHSDYLLLQSSMELPATKSGTKHPTKARSSSMSEEELRKKYQTIELMLKRKIKEIKSAFKQIRLSKKLECAEGILSLLNSYVAKYPVPSAVLDAEGSMLLGDSTSSASSSYVGGVNSDDLAEEDTLPCLVISERKRKSIGTYKCSICKKEGHNSRSCDFKSSSRGIGEQEDGEEEDLVVVGGVENDSQYHLNHLNHHGSSSTTNCKSDDVEEATKNLLYDEELIKNTLLKPHDEITTSTN